MKFTVLLLALFLPLVVYSEEQIKAALKFGENAPNFAEQLLANMNNVGHVLGALRTISSVFGFAGAAFELITALQLEESKKQVMREFRGIFNNIDSVANDIRHLEDVAYFEGTKGQYAESIFRVQSGIDYLKLLPDNVDIRANLENLNNNDNYKVAMDMLFAGALGEGLLNNDIFQSMYDYTRGDARQLSELGEQMILLLSGGLTVMTTYEAMSTDEQRARNKIQLLYENKIERVGDRIQTIFNKTKTNFQINALVDMEDILDNYHTTTNENINSKMHARLTSKYPWFTVTTLVYNDVSYKSHHYFVGQYLSKFDHHGKSAVAFYVDSTLVQNYSLEGRYNWNDEPTANYHRRIASFALEVGNKTGSRCKKNGKSFVAWMKRCHFRSLDFGNYSSQKRVNELKVFLDQRNVPYYGIGAIDFYSGIYIRARKTNLSVLGSFQTCQNKQTNLVGAQHVLVL